MEQSGPTSDQRRQHRRQQQQPWPRQQGCITRGGGVIGVTVSVTEDGVEIALTGVGAGVTGGAGTRDAVALCCVSAGDPGERGLGAVAVAGPEGTGHGAVA